MCIGASIVKEGEDSFKVILDSFASRDEVIDSRFFGSPYPALELMDCLLLRMRVVDAPKVPSQSIGLLNAWIQLKEQCYTMHLIACPLRWQLIQ